MYIMTFWIWRGIIENKVRSHRFYFKYLWYGIMQLAAGAV